MLKYRVLVVEDNPHVANLITDGLEGAAKRHLGGRISFSFDVVENGQAALEFVGVMSVDLIICDVYMPIMDGSTFLQRLRMLPHCQVTPVIALSAGGDSAKQAALQAGANLFLDKPLRLKELLNAALEVLPKDRAPA